MTLAAALTLTALAATAEPAAPPEPPVVVSGAADVELLQAVRAIADKAAAWRGSRFPSSPLAVRGGDAQRREVAASVLGGWIERAGLAARGRAWSDLGLGSEGTVAEVYAALAGDLDGFALSSDGRRLLVDPERLSEKDFGPTEDDDPAVALLLATGVRPDEPAVAHLADHALDLQTGAAPDASTTDALLAARAWSEGRANVLACRLLFEGVGAADVVHGPTFDPASVLEGRLVPRAYFSGSEVARSLLYFVYGEGYAQAAGLAKESGPAAIARAAAARRTSRDVLHADRPTTGAAPIEVPTLPLPAGYVLADRDSLGEQGIVTLVSVTTGKDNLGLLAGDGWRGDALWRFEPDPGTAGPAARGVTLWISRWVSATEAEDFAYGMGRVLQARFPDRPIEAAGPGRKVVRTGDRVFRLDVSGETVTVRSAAPREDGILEGPPPKPTKTRSPR